MKMDKIEKVIQSFRKKINEESPTMSLGKGGIAETVETGDDPPVKRKKKNIYLGLGSRSKWKKYLDSK